MTEQTEGAEVLQNEMHRFLGSACDDVSDLDAPPCWTLAQRILASDWLAAREAAAEVRGAQAVLAAVEKVADEWTEWSRTRSTQRIDAFRDAAERVRDAARAAAAAAGGGGEA